MSTLTWQLYPILGPDYPNEFKENKEEYERREGVVINFNKGEKALVSLDEF